MRRQKLSIVIPFYQEQDAIAPLFGSLVPVVDQLERMDLEVEIVCVNDGSSDATLDRLLAAGQVDRRVRVIDLSRNFGKEAALSAGIDEATGDAVVPLDADLQDPPELIVRMVRLWREGYPVVTARRSDRSSDSFGKKWTARLFYRIHNHIADVPVPDDVGDYRLMDRQVVNALKQMPERRRFMKGLFAWVGFQVAEVTYVRPLRRAGSTKFSGWRLWNLALEGITSFSTVPLRIWTYLGLLIALMAFGYGAFIVLRTLVLGVDVPGYASLLTTVLFLGGVQLISLGVIGEYIGRVYMEVKARPLYVIRARYPSQP